MLSIWAAGNSLANWQACLFHLLVNSQPVAANINTATALIEKCMSFLIGFLILVSIINRIKTISTDFTDADQSVAALTAHSVCECEMYSVCLHNVYFSLQFEQHNRVSQT